MPAYWEDIEAILAPGLGCMENIQIATDEGVFEVRLDDYDTVTRLHEVIAAAINAWERDPTGSQWAFDPRGHPIQTKAHSMPPGFPLPIENVDTFLQWVADGMPRAPAVA
jgi:hypothetical protein